MTIHCDSKWCSRKMVASSGHLTKETMEFMGLANHRGRPALLPQGSGDPARMTSVRGGARLNHSMKMGCPWRWSSLYSVARRRLFRLGRCRAQVASISLRIAVRACPNATTGWYVNT